jgi:hypothetical protein
LQETYDVLCKLNRFLDEERIYEKNHLAEGNAKDIIAQRREQAGDELRRSGVTQDNGSLMNSNVRNNLNSSTGFMNNINRFNNTADFMNRTNTNDNLKLSTASIIKT